MDVDGADELAEIYSVYRYEDEIFINTSGEHRVVSLSQATKVPRVYC